MFNFHKHYQDYVAKMLNVYDIPSSDSPISKFLESTLCHINSNLQDGIEPDEYLFQILDYADEHNLIESY